MKDKYTLTIRGILANSFKTTLKNGKLLLSILLWVFFTLSFFELGFDFISEPLLYSRSYESSKVVTHHYSGSSKFDESSTNKDAKIFLVLTISAMALSWSTLFYFAIFTISSSSAAYTAKALNIKDMFLWTRKKWKAAFMTTIYMSLLSIGASTLYIILLGLGSIVTDGYGSYFLKAGASVLLEIVCIIYMSLLWVLSLVVSVVEEECSGLKAIDRAKEILKGKWVKACTIMVLFAIVGSGIYMFYYVVMGKLRTTYWEQLGVKISSIWSYCLVKFLLFVVYTVFYHECKNSEKDEEGEGKLGVYLPIASGDV